MSRLTRAWLVISACLIVFCLVQVLLLIRLEGLGRSWQKHTDLAFHALAQGNQSQAKLQFQTALAAAERLGSTDVRTAITLNDLADVALIQKDYKAAEDVYRRSSEISKTRAHQSKNDLEVLGSYSTEMLRSLRGVAEAKRNQGDTTSAGKLLAQALELTRSFPVDEHQARLTAADYMKLPVYEHGGEVPEDAFGMSSANLCLHRTETAPDIGLDAFKQEKEFAQKDAAIDLAIRQGRFGDAEGPAKQLLADSLKTNDIDQARESYGRLGDLYFAKKQYSLAEQYLKDGLKFTEEKEDGSRAGRFMSKLAWLYKSADNIRKAEEMAEAAQQRDLRDQKFARGLGLRTFLTILWDQKKFDPADQVCLEMIQQYDKLPAKDEVTACDFELARAQGMLYNKKFSEAEKLLRDCEKTYRIANERGSANKLCAAQAWLADCLYERGRFMEAQAFYRKAFAAQGAREFGAGAYLRESRDRYLELLNRDKTSTSKQRADVKGLLLVSDPFLLDDIRWLIH